MLVVCPAKLRIWNLAIAVLIALCMAGVGVLHLTFYLHRNGLFYHQIPFVFPESALAHALLDGLRGLEIGASAHNPFGLRTINVDFSNSSELIFKRAERQYTGREARVDIVAEGDNLPFTASSWDFVISSHVIEHFYDPIAAIEEWLRVVKPGGLVYMIVPHQARTFDHERAISTVAELLARHRDPTPLLSGDDKRAHHSVWTREAFLALCQHLGWRVIASQDADDKVGNGFTKNSAGGRRFLNAWFNTHSEHNQNLVIQKPYC